MELSTYFRINARNTGQFERTLIVCDEGSYVSYLEGCTAPMRDENQLHAAIVEIMVMDNAEVKYSTVQNWYPGDAEGKGGVLNLVTKRGLLKGVNSKLSWTQVETGSAITWKYPSCVLQGDNSVAEFYSVAVLHQHSTGTRQMTHLGAGCVPVACPKHLPSVRIIDFSQAGKGNSLMVQQLKLCTFSADGWVQSLVEELRSHKPTGKAKKKREKEEAGKLKPTK